MDSEEGKSYRTQSFIGSLIFHAGILAIFFFFVLKTPNPPLDMGGSGIELNYGTVDEGFGDVQTKNQADASPISEEAAPSNIPPVEESQLENTVQENSQEQNEEPIQKSTDEESPAIEQKKIETKKEEIKKIESKEEKKIEIPVKGKEVEKKEATVKENSKSEVSVKSSNNGSTGTEVKVGGNSNGDKPGKIGDQGNPEGTLNAKALYGNPGEGGEGSGGSGGNKLDLTGWKLAFKLEKKDITNENGKIVYQIKVDDKGDLVSIVALEKTVSPAVEKFYRQQIEDNWAVDRSKDNTNPPPIATGKYTVFVRSK